MKVEVGKYYRTRSGDTVGPVWEREGSDWPFRVGDGTHPVMADGADLHGEQGRDLVYEIGSILPSHLQFWDNDDAN